MDAKQPWRARSARPLAAGALALTVALAACGGAASTPTPTAAPPTATPTRAPTATTAPSPTRAAPVSPTGTAARATVTRAASPSPVAANPAAVTAAYANLQKLDSYHLDIVVSGLSKVIPFGLGDTLTYRIDYYKGNQRVQLVDGSGATQEFLKIGDRTYSIINGQAVELPTPPILLTLPDLLYSNLTAPGVTTFTAAGEERVNDRAATKYTGSGQLAGLAGNPCWRRCLLVWPVTSAAPSGSIAPAISWWRPSSSST